VTVDVFVRLKGQDRIVLVIGPIIVLIDFPLSDLIVFEQELLTDILVDALDHDVVDDVVLGVQDDVAELAEVLNDVVGLEGSLDDHRILLVEIEVGVLNELFDDWVQDSVVIEGILLQP